MGKRVIFPVIFTLISLYLSSFDIITVHAKKPDDLKKEVFRKERDIESINRKMEKKGKQIETLRKRKRSVLDEIHNIDMALERGEEELRRIEKKQKKIDRGVREVEMEFKTLQDRSLIIKDSLRGRLIAMYKNRQGGALRVLFSTNGLDDLGRNLRYIKLLVNHDILLLNAYKENQNRLKEKKERLDSYRMELDISKKEYIAKSESLLSKRTKRRFLIKEIDKKKGLQLIALKELAKRSLALQSLIEYLREDIKKQETEEAGTGFVSMKGKLDMPVKGKIISLYGKVRHPRFKTLTFNKGIEIRTLAGDEVKSVFRGEVAYEGWFKGYGKMMIIDHGGGYYTLFAHLSKSLKRVGEHVEKAEVVALAGDTGSLNGSVLYFEVRFHGVPKDPLEWVAQR